MELHKLAIKYHRQNTWHSMFRMNVLKNPNIQNPAHPSSNRLWLYTGENFISPSASKICPLRNSITMSKGSCYGFNNKTSTQTKSTENNNTNQTTENKLNGTNRTNNNRKEREKGTTKNIIEWNE
jgi:hypothetical protein